MSNTIDYFGNRQWSPYYWTGASVGTSIFGLYAIYNVKENEGDGWSRETVLQFIDKEVRPSDEFLEFIIKTKRGTLWHRHYSRNQGEIEYGPPFAKRITPYWQYLIKINAEMMTEDYTASTGTDEEGNKLPPTTN